MPNIYGTKLTQGEWDKIEKEFLAGFYRYFEELNGSLKFLRKNKKNPFIRSQVCIAFVAVDTFSRFHRIFQGEKDEKELNFDNEKRFKDWLNEFVFTSGNKTYTKHKDKIRCDASVVWRLRNSFLHFYSFPKPGKGNRVGFVFNIPPEEYRDMERELRKTVDKDFVFVDVRWLIESIFQGFLLQLKRLADMIESDPEKYIDVVLFTREIVMQEGASTINMTNLHLE